jgi:predicted RNase H-like HicB family nuclease
MHKIKIIVEEHPDGYVAYPLDLSGVVVGQGDTYEEALKDVNSAIKFHIETFGPEVLSSDAPMIGAVLTETEVDLGAYVPSRCSKVYGNQSITYPRL